MVALSLLLYSALHNAEGALVRLVVVCSGSVEVVAQHFLSVKYVVHITCVSYIISVCS